MTLEQVRARVAGARVARLATLRDDGTPQLVPFCFVLDGERLLSVVDGKPKRTRRLQRLANLRRDPRSAVLVDHYGEDWTRLWWVRLETIGTILPDGAAADRARALLRDKYPQYRRAGMDVDGPVLSLAISRWSAWEADGGA